MKVFVFDTSALIRLYVPDGPLPNDAERALDLAGRAEAVAMTPELALVEAAQALFKKQQAGFLAAAECDQILSAMLNLPLEVIGHRPLVASAIEIARSFKLTVYDALFMALARSERATLISADHELIDAWSKISS